jgi:Chaperone for flagella basal body P-ring formation
MKTSRIACVGGVILLVLAYRAEAACRALPLRESVEVGPGVLSLADLLPAGAAGGGCPELYRAAARVSLGAAPRAGSERVLDGREIRGRLEQIENSAASGREGWSWLAQTPERIVVRLAGARKSCAEVADFLAQAQARQGLTANDAEWRGELNCGGAGSVPQSAPIELTKTAWNPLLQRWEFALRCLRAGQCVPFLVWARGANGEASLPAIAPGAAPDREAAVKRGQRATLTWDESGIRIVLPVTCLEAGAVGQSIRVRLDNGRTTLRAEVAGAGALRVSL